MIKGGFPGPDQNVDGYNIGGINGSGQVPDIPGLPNLIDNDTPDDALTRTGWDGDQYSLVFSDEFNTDGRTFWPGDDPFWEAVDLHYWATTDLEWYDPDAMVTEGGNLVITLSEEPIHDLNFRSGMVQSWNKFCFTGGYVEVRASLPGTPTAMGYWPGAWTLANLVRAGYGATADGVWPYSYDSCDVGTLPNQTWPNGTDPVAAKESGSRDYGGELSYLNGQRLSACTCPGEEHPGPSNNVGRSGAEIDILEGQVDSTGVGSASQSIQIAPMDAGYLWGNTTPDTIIYDEDITFQNIWQGSVNQESLSVITLTDAVSYEGAGYQTYGFEYQPGPDGYITWYYNGNPTWTMQASAIGPDPETQIAQRLVSEEPMVRTWPPSPLRHAPPAANTPVVRTVSDPQLGALDQVPVPRVGQARVPRPLHDRLYTRVPKRHAQHWLRPVVAPDGAVHPGPHRGVHEPQHDRVGADAVRLASQPAQRRRMRVTPQTLYNTPYIVHTACSPLSCISCHHRHYLRHRTDLSIPSRIPDGLCTFRPRFCLP